MADREVVALLDWPAGHATGSREALAFLEALGRRGFALSVFVRMVGETRAGEDVPLPAPLAAIENAAVGGSNAGTVSIQRLPDDDGARAARTLDQAHLYAPSDDADAVSPAEDVRAALVRGIKVIAPRTPDVAPDPDALSLAVDDFVDGWFAEPSSPWFAKLFPDPVQITAPQRIAMALGATVNPRAILLNGVFGEQRSHIALGRGTHLGADALLNLGPTDFEVGHFTLISANFSCHAMRHALTHLTNFSIGKGPFAFLGETYDRAAPVRIGHDVWIGEGVTVLPGVRIANGCVIGAGSVVTANTEPYGIYAGNPARLIRYRFEADKIAILNESAWWLLPFRRLREIQDAFRRDVSSLSLDELKAVF